MSLDVLWLILGVGLPAFIGGLVPAIIDWHSRKHELAHDKVADRRIAGLPDHPFCACVACAAWRKSKFHN